MPTITKIQSFDSGLEATFRLVHSIEVEEAPFSSGGFGDVYLCRAVNGHAPEPPQVIKILRDDGTGNHQRGIATIQKLQKKIIEYEDRCRAAGSPGLRSALALQALPQFSFLGEMDGRTVVGYSANHLDSAAFLPLSHLLDEGFEILESLPREERIHLSAELAEGFLLLRRLSFIHADINPPNLLVDVHRGQIAIIDFDSGVVSDRPGEQPTTPGKKGPWLAPEIAEQLRLRPDGGGDIQIDFFSDRWSVFIAIHYLLLLMPPFFFFSRHAARVNVVPYLDANSWPEIHPDDPLFNPEVLGNYQLFRELLDSLPVEIVNKLKATVNEGYSNPPRRTSAEQWALELRHALPPLTVLYFEAVPASVVAGLPIRLRWSTTGAREVFLDHGLGPVAAEGELEILPSESREYTLMAAGRWGSLITRTATVRVWQTPTIRQVDVPTLEFAHQAHLRIAPSPPPSISLPLHLNLGLEISAPKAHENVTEMHNASLDRLFQRLRNEIARLKGEVA